MIWSAPNESGRKDIFELHRICEKNQKSKIYHRYVSYTIDFVYCIWKWQYCAWCNEVRCRRLRKLDEWILTIPHTYTKMMPFALRGHIRYASSRRSWIQLTQPVRGSPCSVSSCPSLELQKVLAGTSALKSIPVMPEFEWPVERGIWQRKLDVGGLWGRSVRPKTIGESKPIAHQYPC